jgi:tRNA(Ile)-lysidine synthase
VLPDGRQILARLPRAPEYQVAYSGGVDSHVLLFILAGVREQLPGELVAVHVNHGIQQASGDWEVHCRAICEQLGVRFRCIQVQGRAGRGESPEAVARAARYRGLAQSLPADAVLLTAQHRDDQAETLLLQLFRGAGVRGLASMPEQMPFGQGQLLRPFLFSSRKEIVACARQHRLCWVVDPANRDLRYDRNFVRHQLLPQLQQRWPAVAHTLSRAAAHQADQVELAAVVAEMDYAHCRGRAGHGLQVDQVRLLSVARQRNLLRFWIEHNGLSLPSRVVIERILEELLESDGVSSPLVHWPDAEVRRYRNCLYAMAPPPAHVVEQIFCWAPEFPLSLENAGGELTASREQGAGLVLPDVGQITIRFRQGGEQLQPAGRQHHHRLKKLLQEWGVPPWERNRIPLVYVGDTLVAVAGLCVTEGFHAGADETGWLLRWSRRSAW